MLAPKTCLNEQKLEIDTEHTKQKETLQGAGKALNNLDWERDE